jgi:hypothetical protein
MSAKDFNISESYYSARLIVILHHSDALFRARRRLVRRGRRAAYNHRINAISLRFQGVKFQGEVLD